MTKIAEILLNHQPSTKWVDGKTQFLCTPLVSGYHCGHVCNSPEEFAEHLEAVLTENGIGDMQEAFDRGQQMGHRYPPYLEPSTYACVCGQPWSSVTGRTCPVHGYIAPARAGW